MWYEILFPASAMMLFLSLPEAVLPRWNAWWYGNAHHPKNIEDDAMLQCHFRNMNRSGDPWRPFGVEKIPDEMPENM